MHIGEHIGELTNHLAQETAFKITSLTIIWTLDAQKTIAVTVILDRYKYRCITVICNGYESQQWQMKKWDTLVRFSGLEGLFLVINVSYAASEYGPTV